MKERFLLQTYLLTRFQVDKGMSTPTIDRLARWGRADYGNTILFVMVLISVMALLGNAITNRVLLESHDTFRNLHRIQAFYLAEAGIENARYDMTGQDLSSLLKGPDGLPNTADDGTLSFGGTVAIGNGSCTIIASDNNDGDGDPFNDSDGLIDLTSTGNVSEASYQITVCIASSRGYYSPHALAVGTDLTISGAASITGLNGSVHANGDLLISGNPTVAQNATASATYTVGGNPLIGGASGGGYPPEAIPAVVPSDYLSNADYILKSNGNVEDDLGNVIATNAFAGWVWGGSKWDIAASTSIDGTYYIEGDAVISGQPGDPFNPWRVTIIAEGSVEIAGSPNIQYNLPDLLIVAGGDLKINGNINQTLEGYFLVHEQVEVSGNPTLVGAIVAEDVEDLHGLVHENKISGTMNLLYNGDMGIAPGIGQFAAQRPRIMSWRG